MNRTEYLGNVTFPDTTAKTAIRRASKNRCTIRPVTNNTPRPIEATPLTLIQGAIFAHKQQFGILPRPSWRDRMRALQAQLKQAQKGGK